MRAYRRNRYLITGITISLLLVASLSGAEPARNRFLDEVHVTDQGACSVIRVGFTLPIRYVRHFPPDRGEELRIKLDPIAVSPVDRPALGMRESLRPTPNGHVPLHEVVFEGDMEGGPFLTLDFSRMVNYAVRQGRDFRSLIIAVTTGDGVSPAQCRLTEDPGE